MVSMGVIMVACLAGAAGILAKIRAAPVPATATLR
jgi:hypothetical protein